jgi:polysaccharide export outer membrane protein
MKKIFISFWIISICALFAACSSVVRTPGALADRPEMAASAGDYRIQLGDALDIKFFYHPELNEGVIVRPDGRISLQLVHEVQASGLTPEQLRKDLQDKYSNQISQPEIAVIVRSFTAQKIYVDVEVARPGLIPLTGPMTVLQSIASAGGLKDTARINEIILIRRGPENRPASMLVNVGKAIDGSDLSQDLTLQAADIVYVPRSPIANVNLWVDQYIRKTIPISLGASYNTGTYTNR